MQDAWQETQWEIDCADGSMNMIILSVIATEFPNEKSIGQPHRHMTAYLNSQHPLAYTLATLKAKDIYSTCFNAN